MSVVWPELDDAFGKPDREAHVLDWLQARTPGEWARLDESERSWRSPHKWIASGADSTLARGWRSFSPNGHERERAVAALDADPHEAAIGFLLVRCDDWVAPVKLLARLAVVARARTSRMDLSKWMPLVLARDQRSRSDGLLEACLAAAPDGFDESLMAHNARSVRRWALSRFLAREPSAAEVGVQLDRTIDPAVARTLAVRMATLGDDAALLSFLGDRRVGVRRVAWERVAVGRLAVDDLRGGLFDASTSIRALAQQAARARRFDAGRVYLEAPAGTAMERRRRLLWLGEWGAVEALPIAQAALDDPDQAVRVAAIRVVARRMNDPATLLLALMRHCRGPELRAVRRALIALRIRVSDADLAVLRRGDQEQRMAAWRLGMARGRWERLLADLHAAGDPDESLAQNANGDVGNWCIRIAPEAGWAPAEMRLKLKDALAEAPVDSRWRQLIEFVLRTT